MDDLVSAAGPACPPVAEDLIALARRFAEARDAETVRVRFETLMDDACRKFHLDNVDMRLVVTYAGAGTQWIAPAHAAKAREQQTNYEGPINSIPAGDVAIFRGKKSNASNLILHRSPPLPSNAQTRVIAVIDNASF